MPGLFFDYYYYMMDQLSFLPYTIPHDTAETIQHDNPQWQNKPGVPIPHYHRWMFHHLWRLIHNGLTPAIVLRGPRRVGKTVLMRQLIQSLLKEDRIKSQRILYIAFDDIASLGSMKDPILCIARWYEQNILKMTFNETAEKGESSYLLFDEVQNLKDWAPQIKHLVDNNDVRVVVTGSSSLRIEAGRDSLAGRITTLDLGTLMLREIAALSFGEIIEPFWKDDGLDAVVTQNFWRDALQHSIKEQEIREKAFHAFSERGAYPISHERKDAPWQEISGLLNETVIRRAIQHDLRMGPRGTKRDEKLLEEVFRLCCRYAGQSPGQAVFIPEIQQALNANIGWNRILNYLRFLDGALLIRLIQPLEIRLKRKKSQPKICLCDHSLRASWLQEIIPLDPQDIAQSLHLSDLAGHIAESALGYYLASIPNLDLAHFPERGPEPEVDFVLTIGLKRIPIEVKYRRSIDPFDDTRGLRAFLEKTVYNAPFGLLVTQENNVSIPDPRIVPISLSSLLWLR